MNINNHNSNPCNWYYLYRLSSIVIDCHWLSLILISKSWKIGGYFQFSDLLHIQHMCLVDYGCDIDRVCCERVPWVWVYFNSRRNIFLGEENLYPWRGLICVVTFSHSFSYCIIVVLIIFNWFCIFFLEDISSIELLW